MNYDPFKLASDLLSQTQQLMETGGRNFDKFLVAYRMMFPNSIVDEDIRQRLEYVAAPVRSITDTAANTS